MPKKYKMGTLASEEHRYSDAVACHTAAQNFYFYNGDYPGVAEPPHIEVPRTTNPDDTTIYSWRSPGTDVEMRFIVVTILVSSEIIRYYRVEGGYGKDEEADLKEAMTSGELGVGSIKRDTSPVNGKKVLRAIVKSETLTGDSIGYTTNPPYPP